MVMCLKDPVSFEHFFGYETNLDGYMVRLDTEKFYFPTDLRVILEEEACTSKEKGWEFLRKTNEGDEVWRKSVKSEPVNIVKGILKFPGIPSKDLEEIITNLDIRRKWDKRFKEIDLLEEKSKYQVIYWRMVMPTGVSDRDIIQNVSKRRDESQNMTYILHKNANHPTKPEVPGVVRAETILTGTIIRPDKDDPKSSTVTLLLQNDPKGWIPTWVVNSFATNSPIEWKHSICQYYQKYKK